MTEQEVADKILGALKKQTPTKPMISWDEKVKENWYSCGVCAKSFGWKRAIKTMEYNYCPSCGTKIDWSEQE